MQENAKPRYFLDHYEVKVQKDGSELLDLQGKRITSAEAGSDLQALMKRYILVRKIMNAVLG